MPKPTFAIYGIKDRNHFDYPAFTHDHNLCLMDGGKVLQYLQLERYTRRKYDNRLDMFLEGLLDEKILDLPDKFDIISVNSFVGSAFVSNNGRIRFETSPNSKVKPNLQKATAWFQLEQWTGKAQSAFNISHELAHVSSNLPFFGGFKENSLWVHFDGGASKGNFSAFTYKNGKIKLLESHWELSHLSKFFNDNALAFAIIGAKPGEHCSVPGKLMGYAAMGNFDEKIAHWLRKNHYFKEIWLDSSIFFKSVKTTFGMDLMGFDNHQVFLQDVANVFQHDFEVEILKKIHYLQKRTQAKYLYYSGGCALNILANTKLVNSNYFEDIFIPPCCNDSGLSLGAASFLEWKKHGQIDLHYPYLNNIGLKSSPTDFSLELIKSVAAMLLQRKVIGISNDAGEVGPRALGNRSLLALADSPELTQKVSQKIKKREWFRPVAPIMLAKNAALVTGHKPHHLSKYMLLDFKVLPQFQVELIGVIHSKQTARIQVIFNRLENPFIHDLLLYLDQHHGVKALLNTSFNVQGEPIVHTPDQALQSAKSMKIDAVVINYNLHKL
jgi:carbamoyltransferase